MPASVTIRSRVDSTDLLRGTVMILMALDHTQDFFSAAGMNPRDVTGPALFTNSRSSSKPFGRRKYTLRSDREDQLLARLYGGKSVPGVIRLQARGSAPSSNSNRGGIEQAHAELKRAIEHLQELMPDATATVTITYRGQ